MLPIKQDSYMGNPESSVAVCTLSSLNLLADLAAEPQVLDDVCVLGRLLSENKGVDAVLHTLYANPRIDVVIVCGADGAGHKAGHSLFKLHANGIDADRRISGSHSPEPYLDAPREQIEHFCQNVRLINMMGVTDRIKIMQQISRLN